MNMRNKIYTFLLLVAAMVSTPVAQAQDNVIDEVIWIVGDEAILKSEVEEDACVHNMRGNRYRATRIASFPSRSLFRNSSSTRLRSTRWWQMSRR